MNTFVLTMRSFPLNNTGLTSLSLDTLQECQICLREFIQTLSYMNVQWKGYAHSTQCAILFVIEKGVKLRSMFSINV